VAKEDDVYGTEEDNIPDDVLEVMGKSGIGESGDVETKVDDDTGGEQDGSDDKGDTGDTEKESEDTGSKEAGDASGEGVDDEETSGDTEATDDETEPVPQEHVTIGRRYGWSDEKIIKMSEEHPDILEDMGRLIGRQNQPAVEQKVVPAATQKQEVKGVDKVELDDATLSKMKESYGNEVVDSVISPLVAGLNTAIDQVNALRGQVDGQTQTNRATQAQREHQEANVVFDGLSETFTVFGKTEELPRTAEGGFDVNSPAVKARSQVYDVALAFKNSGMGWSDSLKQATRWYKGEHAEKALERKIVKDVIARKKKFSPRPTNKKTKKAFKSREDEGEDLVRTAYSK